VSTVNVVGSKLGNNLQALLMADDIEPGSEPSYQLCKTIYLFHPLGLKMTEWPVRMAQSQDREISVPRSPESRVKDAFVAEWAALGADEGIFQVASLARTYGVATIAMLVADVAPSAPVDPFKLPDLDVTFSVFDPLNTSGSLVLNQQPNAADFLKTFGDIKVSGTSYHRSRTCVVFNERPVYLAYTNSAFGFVGRSVFQRTLFPLKSFVQTMVTDDMVTRKAGVFIAKLKAFGSIVDNVMQAMAGLKRMLIKQAQTENVISVGVDEDVQTLNMQNLDGAYGMARKNILENIASGADMPAKILTAETFAEGFGEGTEDAKHVARYVDRLRKELGALYDFFTRIAQHRAWSPAFFEAIKNEFPEEYGGMDYKRAFYQWANSFKATWPNLLTEPDSEKAKAEEVKHKAIVATVEALAPLLDPENKATLVDWAAANLNDNKVMFQNPLIIDFEALANYVPPAPTFGEKEGGDGEEGGEPKEPKPKLGRSDSVASFAEAAE
jgi:hypothetical protein